MKKLLLLLSIIVARQIHGQIITTVAGNGTFGYSGDGGQAINAELAEPASITLDAVGNLYISDVQNNRIRKVDISGVISTIAGSGVGNYGGDGGQATLANIRLPFGTVFDAAGNMYISDYGNQLIRFVNASGIISTVVGDGVASYNGDGGLASSAEVNYPSGLIFDAMQNLYIADLDNARIRKINASGIISTVAGNGSLGFSGDGGLATSAELYKPNSIALDALGNLYITDMANQRVRKVNTSGIITTIAGTGVIGFSGDGGLAIAAKLYNPTGVAVDVAGNIYIADSQNNRIRKIDTSGIINTIAGNGTFGFSGDGGMATSAKLGVPWGMIFDNSGNMYIADQGNQRIRKVTNVVDAKQISKINKQVNIYPNPASDQFFLDANTADKLTVDLYDVDGRQVFSANVSDKSNINVTTLDKGIYTMTIKSVDRVTNKKLVIVR